MMSDALIVTIIPAMVAGIAAMYRIAKEAGRAEAYREESERTLAQKDRELDAVKSAFASCQADLRSCSESRLRLLEGR